MTKQQAWRIAAVTVLVLTGAAGIAYWYFDMGHPPVEKMPFLHGKTTEQVESILGQPDETHLIGLGEIKDEFRCELLNYYSPDKVENKGVEFKELWWKRSRYTITVWFHRLNGQWVAIDSCRWKKGVVF
jgi:hypothetical protein